jgi:hypothetical protein
LTSAPSQVASAPSPSQVACAIEPALEADLNFIRHTWMRSLRVPPAHWPGCMRTRDMLLERCPPIVARLEGEADSICGWACFAPDVIHFVFVRSRWHRLGVASMLLEPFRDRPTVTYTHRTPALSAIPMPKGWTFNPYAIIEAE